MALFLQKSGVIKFADEYRIWQDVHIFREVLVSQPYRLDF